ncbi:hypothetical protein [Pelagicoccus sp. SDUM812005]|uniref:hypothetical protein n=1 Tax=Pelagicoccus sp. SDUM812005 TaxID=3041257 RepID=UPI00280EF0B7|nr:hypothetical protein [Pelagicoccus sp. SDUM812005]MDQ8183410.1 hypothetical protein [Pelagicoccus sp. SDUM812005]
MKSAPLKVLFDSGARVHSDLLEGASIDHSLMWGDRRVSHPVVGYVRKKSGSTEEQQSEIDALFTIGRLIREGRIQAYSSHEIQIELMRGRMRTPDLNAFEGCEFSDCPPALYRSKFRSTINFEETISKGGKKDRKKGGSDFTQIGFMSWLVDLEPRSVELIPKYKKELNLTNFEVESLGDLDWFRALSSKLRSKENLPDAFHVWTARRNEMDIFLTLDGKLSNSIKAIRSEKKLSIDLPPKTLLPRDLLASIGITSYDDIPIKPDTFYYLHDIRRIKQNQAVDTSATSRRVSP